MKPRHDIWSKVGAKLNGNPAYVEDIQKDFDARRIFEQDILVTQEFNSARTRREHLEPEKQLMFAVLDDAVYCFQKYISSSDKAGRRLFQEADEWFQEKDNDALFTFESVCSYLGLDADYIRGGLNRWKEAVRKAAAEKAAGIGKTPTEIYLKVIRRGRKSNSEKSAEDISAATA